MNGQREYQSGHCMVVPPLRSQNYRDSDSFTIFDLIGTSHLNLD